MLQDLSKQDKSAQPEEFSVEDIIKEFSDDSNSPEKKAPSDAAAPEALQEELPSEPTPMSQSEMASAIAQVLEHAFAEPQVETMDSQEAEQEPKQPEAGHSVQEEKVPSAEKAEAPEASDEREAASASTKSTSNRSGPSDQTNEAPKQRDHDQAPSEQNASKGKRQSIETAANPNTRHVKIPRSRRTPGALEYIGTMILDIRRRQLAAYPAPGASPRKREKQLLTMVRVEHILSYIRYGILLLMCMCLAGRRFQWMALGFMKGLGGTYTALVLTVFCFFLSWQSTIRAVRDLLYLRFSYETLLLIATILSMLEAISTKNETSLLPLLTMAWCLSGTADKMNQMGNLRALRGVITARGRKGVRVAEEKWEGRDCIGKSPASLVSFVRHQAYQDVFHTVLCIYGLLFFIVTLVVSAYLSGKTQGNYLTILSSLLSVGMPVGAVLCCAHPYRLLCRALYGQGAVAGWYGIKGLSGKKSVLIYDRDLFPQGATQHKGVRVYGTMDPRTLTSYGASMIFQSGIGLDAVFTRLLREVNGEVYPISHFRIQESGMEGYIHHNLVQVGSFQYMQLMGISLPSRAPRYGVYLAVNQKLEGVFAIKYEVSKGAPAGFRRFVREPELSPVLVTRNFCINPAFVEHWFGAPITSLTCPKADVRQKLSEPSLMHQGAICGFMFKDGVGPYSRLVAGARRVYRMGLFFSLTAVLLSCYTTVKTVLALSAGAAIVTGPRLLLVHLILMLLVEICARIALRK